MSTTSTSPSTTAEGVTALIEASRRGEEGARRELFARLYGKLKKIAVSRLKGERPDHTLAPTALVHEAYLKLCGKELSCRDRADFCGVVSNAMRRILIDSARRRRAGKRDAGPPMTFDEDAADGDRNRRDAYLVALDASLERLEQADAGLAAVVALRFFGGFSVAEIAEMLEIGTATVKRRFRLAKAWLHRDITEACERCP